MRVAFHLGAHCTDDELLIRSLLRNRKLMADHGTFVGRPKRFRSQTRELMLSLKGGVASAAEQAELIETMLGAVSADRLVLSFHSFLCGPNKAFSDGQFYSMAGEKTRWLRNLLPDHAPEFFMAIRNPATFIPAVHEMADDGSRIEKFLGGSDPLQHRWSDVIRLIREENPDAPLTVWCNEDTPLIWPTVLREVADLDQLAKLQGEYDIIRQIMKPEGYERMLSYLDSHPPHNEIQRRRVLAAFLDKFAIEDEVHEEIELPGWTPELVHDLTTTYEEDLFEIERMPGVTVITP